MFLLRSFMAQISVQLYRPFRLVLAWKGYEKNHSLHFSKQFYRRQGKRLMQQEIVHKLVHEHLSK